jgi:hypothetical protein
MSFKEGIDYFNGQVGTLNMFEVTNTDEEKFFAKKYLVKRGACDVCEILGL